MKITVERTQYEPTYKDGVAVSWNVAWTIETDTGLSLYVPTTVFRRDLDRTPTEAAVTVQAFKVLMPGQIQHIYKDVDVVDELDQIMEETYQEEQRIIEQSEHNRLLRRQREDSINAAKQRLEAVRAQRRQIEQDALNAENGSNSPVPQTQREESTP